MTRNFAWLCALGVAASACADAEAPTEPEVESLDFAASSTPESLANRYIVVLRGSAADVDREANRLVPGNAGEVERLYRHALRGFVARIPARKAADLASDPAIELIEEDRVVSVATTQSPTPSWGLDRIDQRSRPGNTSYNYNATGAGVRLYSIDTGVRAVHTDFGGRASGGFTVINDGRGTEDCHGHGTHTASTAAGTTYGVAKGMRVIAVRVFDCYGKGTLSGVIAAVDWVTRNAVKPAVANMSLGSTASSAFDLAVANSIASGVVYVVSAGNSNLSACSASPARVPSAITVAATDATDRRASFSNFGSCVDLFAPGVSIRAAVSGSNTATATMSGTSMSAPHVTGAAGLYLQSFPNSTPAQVAQALAANATTGVVTNLGTGTPNRLLYTGFVVAPTLPSVNQPPVAAFTYTCTAVGHSCTVDGRSSKDDVGVVSWAWTATNRGPQTGPVVTFSWDTARWATITLTVTDGRGLTNKVSRTVAVP